MHIVPTYIFKQVIEHSKNSAQFEPETSKLVITRLTILFLLQDRTLF